MKFLSHFFADLRLSSPPRKRIAVPLRTRFLTRSSGVQQGNIAGLALAVTLIGAVCNADAQVNKLDQDKLIDTLADEGMQELLGRLIVVEPPSDLAEATHLHAKTQLTTYKNEQLSMPQRLEALAQYRQSMNDLIDRQADHIRCPIWQTDLANVLLFEELAGVYRSAAEFYEFGVPSANQRQAFESKSITALQLLADASRRLFELQSQLPRRDDFQQIRDSGLYDRLMQEYAQRRTRYLLSHAAHYTSLISDEHPYYQTLGQHDVMAAGMQTKTPVEERQRLHQQTIDHLEPLTDDSSDLLDVRSAAHGLIGRAYLGLADLDRAQEHLKESVQAANSPIDSLLAQMALAQTQSLRGQTDAALRSAAKLTDHPLAQEQVLFRLLVTDLHHRLLLAKARQAPTEQDRGDATFAAYELYRRFLDDPKLGENALAMKRYVVQRWSTRITDDADLSAFPALVVVALGELALNTGRNLVIDATSTSGVEEAAAMREAGLQKLQQSHAINTEVLRRDDLERAERAKAMANVAYATYYAGEGDVSQVLDSAKLLAELADQMPDQAIAEQAIADAVALLREMYDQLGTQRNARVAATYERATHLLLDKFGTTPAADNERLYFGFLVLQASHRYGRAVQVYSQIPVTHSTYWQAQRERLFCLQQIYRNADQDHKPAAEQTAREASRRLLDQIQHHNTGNGSSGDLKRCQGTARLLLADLAIDGQNYGAAAEWLSHFEDTFADVPELVREAYDKRIVIYLATDQLEDAVRVATVMMNEFPDDASRVISDLLDQVDQQIDQLRKQADEQLIAARKDSLVNEAAAAAQAARTLADLLLRWASAQEFDEEKMLPYELILVKALRLTGEVEQAAQRAGSLLETFPNNAHVIHESAESTFALSTPHAMKDSVLLYRQLYDARAGLRPDEHGHYPPMWWNAWRRQFQITEALNGKTEDIPLLVNQLEMTDPDLGGEPYASEFRRLRNKY